MSSKQQLAEAIAALPDSLSLEEAVERLYRAFRIKPAVRTGTATGSRHLLEEIHALPAEEYAEIVNLLNQEEDYHIDEALRRDQEMDAGSVHPLTHDEVFAEARRRLSCG